MDYPGSILKFGSTGKEVTAIQGRINVGQTGDFGETTENAVREFQKSRGIEQNGMVGPTTWAALFGVPGQASGFPFLQAKHFHGGRNSPIGLFVIHSMEAPEKGNTAEIVAKFFNTTSTVASAHYCIDSDSIVQCVKDTDTAFGAPGANAKGLHFEHAGFARQTAAEWADPYSDTMLWLSARLVAKRAKQHSIPIKWLKVADLKAGQKGITSHHNCSQAFGGSHTDPGASFPVDRYIRYIETAIDFP